MYNFSRKKWVGTPLKRKEDVRFIRGQAEFTDDLNFPGMLHAGFVRSPYAHARIKSIDVSRALALPGVVCALTGEEAEKLTQPFPNNLPDPYSALKDYCMAVGKARYSGEAVAAIVAETKYLAEDAIELVDVEYEALDPVTDAFKGMEKQSALVHDNVPSNACWHRTFSYGDADAALRQSDLVVKEKLYFHRFTSAPLENSVVIASYDWKTDIVTIWSNNQRPMFNMQFLSPALGMPPERIRCINPDIGGGFGIKNDSYPYLVLVVLLAKKAGKPVKWVEDRTQHLTASAHGNEVFYEARHDPGAQGDGRPRRGCLHPARADRRGQFYPPFHGWISIPESAHGNRRSGNQQMPGRAQSELREDAAVLPGRADDGNSCP
jgi:CO/xanthine dehydrogenase Mo-binding subunit